MDVTEETEVKKAELTERAWSGFAPATPTKIMSAEFADAFARAQRNFTPILKTKTNPFFNSKYADLNDVLEATVPALNNEGISFSQPFIEKNGKTFVVSKMIFKGEVYEDDGLPLPTQVKPQEMILYSTYYRRVLSTSLFGVAADEDVDGNDAEQQKGKKDSKPSASVQPPPAKKPAVAAKKVEPKPGPTEPASQSSENIHGVAINDEDIPAIISSIPDDEAKKDYISRLKALIAASDKRSVQHYIAGIVGGEFTTNNLTTAQWRESLEKMEAAEKEGKLKELVAFKGEKQ